MPKADVNMRDLSCIEHMHLYCEQIDESLMEIDSDKEKFMKSHTYQNAVAMCILQIGELAKSLSEDFCKTHNEIPWKQMAKSRDRYAHQYGKTDFEIIWDTAILDIPEIRKFCEGILK